MINIECMFHAGSPKEICRGTETDGAPLWGERFRDQSRHKFAICRHILSHAR